MKLAAVSVLTFVFLGQAGTPGYFTPANHLAGIGVEREDLTKEALAAREDLMIQSQTFVILREAEALAGARRITGDHKLQSIFRSAAESSGLPATLLEAVAYLESWGNPNAESPAGPRGIMQISEAAAHDMNLKITHATRYNIVAERVLVKSKGRKPKYKTVTHRTPYVLIVRDDRLIPDRAIPAAANYLARLERTFGGRDWAIFAYHCGAGCVSEMQELTRKARGIPQNEITVPRMFFSCSPSWNRELYQAIQQQMLRDYSPTYYFRILRAEQLLASYREDPQGFASLQQEYKSELSTYFRAPNRLSVWLRRDDLVYRTAQDIRGDTGTKLVRALNRPDYFGYALRIFPGDPADEEILSQAAPATFGALIYIAFETRRLYLEGASFAESFQPLPVTSLVEPEDRTRAPGHHEAMTHASGEVFDIDYSGLPPRELECLRFVLDDLEWDGYVGFVEEGASRVHIGCAPGSRNFFAAVYRQAAAAVRN